MELYNDFQNMVRSDNLAYVIDRFHLRKGRECIDYDTKIAMNEVGNVLDEMKKCKRSTYAALIKLCRYCALFTVEQMALFLHIISGRPLIEYALCEGISEQAAQQMWERMVAKNPDLANIRKKRHHNGTQRILDRGVAQSQQEA